MQPIVLRTKKEKTIAILRVKFMREIPLAFSAPAFFSVTGKEKK